MKVCLVSPYDYMHPGGVTEHVRHLADVSRERDHQVTVLAPSSRVGDEHGIPGYVRIGRSVPVKSNGSVARIALSFHLVRRVRALLDDSDFDVVHYHEPLVPSLPITVLRFHRGANVATFHTAARRNLGYYYGRPFLGRYFERLTPASWSACRLATSSRATSRRLPHRFERHRHDQVPSTGRRSRAAHRGDEDAAVRRAHGAARVSASCSRPTRSGFVAARTFASWRWETDRSARDRARGPPRSAPRRVLLRSGQRRDAAALLRLGRLLLQPGNRWTRASASRCLRPWPASPGLASAIPASPGHRRRPGWPAGGAEPAARAGQAIDTLLNDEDLCRAMSATGRGPRSGTTWHRVADSILDVYEEVRRSRVHMVAAGVHRQVSRWLGPGRGGRAGAATPRPQPTP